MPDSATDLLGLHPSHRMAMRRVTTILLVLALFMLLAWLIPAPPGVKGIAGYLPLHTLLETVAIIIASLVFAVGWNTHSRHVAGNIVLLACIFLGVGLIDFSHMLSYKGMPDFVTPSDPEKAINFWLIARYLAALGLLTVALLPWQPYASARTRYVLMGASLLFVAATYWVLLLYPEILPRTFIAGQGLTPFKINAEYVLIGINLMTALILWRHMRKPQDFHTAALFGTVCVMGMSEFFFTLYANVTDIFNLLGHIYKVIAYLFLYRALFVETIDKPYNSLKAVQKNLELSIQSSNIGLWDWNIKTNEVLFSPEWKKQLGYQDAELPNQFSTWEKLLHPDDRDISLALVREFINSDNKTFQSEYRLEHRDGSYRWILARGEKQLNRKGEVEHMRGSHIDITERKQAENEIHHLAFYDPLTQLPNRRLLMDRFSQALLLSSRSQKFGAVLFLDLDRFKNINDTLGHEHGDQLLIEVARRISSCVRKEDTIARLGGDEFIILLEEIDTNVAAASRIVAMIADKILGALARPYNIAGHEHHSSCSIGISLFSGNNLSADEIMKHADLAMYQAKNNGRNTVRFFDPAMQLTVEKHTSLEADLRSAISCNQLQLHYQIQVDNQNHPLGAEALIRWKHPQRGMISPMEFIPIAEESSLILDIGQWVLETACQQLSLWKKNPHTQHLKLAVNVSAMQFQMQNFVDIVALTLKKYPIDSSKLKLELTESTVLNDVEDVIRKMHALSDLGIQLSMDDFGTGYSSLSYLTRLPLHQIKIDQSFVRDILLDHNDALMVQTIIQMAQNFKLDVIAEGVETAEQLSFLHQNGCLSYQGYYFSKPVPAAEFETLLARQGWAPARIN